MVFFSELCPDYFITYADVCLPYGTPTATQSSVSTQSDCQTLCEVMGPPGCIAYVQDRNTDECSMYPNNTDLTVEYCSSIHDLGILADCDAGERFI